MALSEDVLEEIFFLHPEEFLPDRRLTRYARQLALGPRAGGSRIDVAFQDAVDGGMSLFEIKAADKMDARVIAQVERYLDEVKRLSPETCECPFPSWPELAVIAPVVPHAVRDALSVAGVAWHEFSDDHFTAVANRHGIPLTLPTATGLRLAYWEALDDYLRRARSSVPGPRPADVNGINLLSSGGIQLTVRCSAQHNCLDVDLTFGTRAAHMFPRFCGRRAEIDRDLAQTVLWFKQGSERHIRVQHWARVRDRADWATFHAWTRAKAETMLRWMNKIQRGF